jgi:EAL domain-containing protein (putative c-di-GMP-specific phosphodiesterase class I)
VKFANLDPPVRKRWELIPRAENSAGELAAIPLGKSPFEVGRTGPRDLLVQCQHVSRKHAEFLIYGRDLYLEDNGSTNGTFINGIRIHGRRQLQPDDIVQFGSYEWSVSQNVDVSPLETMNLPGNSLFASAIEFKQLMVDRAITPNYQPIVNVSSGTTIGYEVLVRSARDGFRSANELFGAATRAGMECGLSELSRSEGMRHGQFLPNNAVRFLNAHPSEIASPNLIRTLEQLREENTQVPIVLEIHESSICNPAVIKDFARQLRQLDIGLAYDDFGQGPSKILELIDAPSDFLKFDIEVIRGIDQAPKARQQMLRSLVQMARDIGIMTIAEGVETRNERDACQEIGFDLVQGYFFGKPQPIELIVASLAELNSSSRRESYWETAVQSVLVGS